MRCDGPPTDVGEAEAVPSVVVYHRPATPAEVLRQVCAGAEEQGVPVRTGTPGDDRSALGLARAAARASRLEVGVGVDGQGRVVVHHAKLPERQPVELVAAGAPAAHCRRAGANAARVVTGLPLDGLSDWPPAGTLE